MRSIINSIEHDKSLRIPCGACGNSNLQYYEKRASFTDVEDVLMTYICPICQTIAIPDAMHEETQGRQYGDWFVDYIGKDPEKVREKIETYRVMMRYLNQFVENIWNKNILDFGCGAGLFSVAAAEEGYKTVIGVDLHDASIHLASLYPIPNNVIFSTNVSSVLGGGGINVVILWHVLEHMRSPINVLETLKKNRSSTEKMTLFIQVPQYDSRYIYREHLHFFSCASMEILLNQAGYEIFHVEYDVVNSFMTICARTT